MPLLSQPWRAIGPDLPPGAAVSALRGIGFFGGAATATPLLVLALWAAAGLILVALPTAATRGRVTMRLRRPRRSLPADPTPPSTRSAVIRCPVPGDLARLPSRRSAAARHQEGPVRGCYSSRPQARAFTRNLAYRNMSSPTDSGLRFSARFIDALQPFGETVLSSHASAIEHVEVSL